MPVTKQQTLIASRRVIETKSSPSKRRPCPDRPFPSQGHGRKTTPTMKASIQIAAAATLLLATGAYAQNLGTMEYVGCYSSSIGLTLTNTSKFQTQGSCQPDCVNDGNQLVLGLTKRFECWCGMTLPPVDTKASNSSCSATCGGFNAPCM